MRHLILIGIVWILSGCAASIDYTKKQDATHIINQCFELTRNAFIFEARCADLTGINNNSEICTGIQIAGEGIFPTDWKSYLNVRDSFDKAHFKKLLLEKQRTMIGEIEKSSKLKITKLVHHAWGVDGFYWVARAEIKYLGAIKEVELPSYERIHHPPLWLNGYSNSVPKIETSFLKQCSD